MDINRNLIMLMGREFSSEGIKGCEEAIWLIGDGMLTASYPLSRFLPL